MTATGSTTMSKAALLAVEQENPPVREGEGGGEADDAHAGDPPAISRGHRLGEARVSSRPRQEPSRISAPTASRMRARVAGGTVSSTTREAT